jgi:hypothetical protein
MSPDHAFDLKMLAGKLWFLIPYRSHRHGKGWPCDTFPQLLRYRVDTSVSLHLIRFQGGH